MSESNTSILVPADVEPSKPEQNGCNGFPVRYSPTLGSLAAALADAQLEFAPIKKQVENTFYFNEKTKKRAMYADLAAIIEATQKPLAKHGLVVLQFPVTDEKRMKAGAISRLVHSSGEWCECELLLPASTFAKRWKDNVQVEYTKFDAQTIGAAVTYARRYVYGAVIGVAAEEDDDANSIGEASQGSREAQKDVAQRKIDKAVESGKVPCLFYAWDDQEQKGYVTGDVKLMTDNKELLLYKGKWDKKANAVIVDANGLEDLKFELEQRGVIFKPAAGTVMTEVLRESIAQVKARKDA